MKPIVVLGLLACVAAAAPLTSAHVMLSEEQEDGSCRETVVGDPDLPPHFAVYTGQCRIMHPGGTLP